MTTIAICIINYNARDLLRSCLLSVLREDPDEVIVIDSASADGSPEMVGTEFPEVNLIRLANNIGYGPAANRGAGHCGSDIVLLLNSDTRLKPGCLKALGNFFDKEPSALIVGPKIVNPNGTPQTSRFHYPTPLHIFLYLTGLYKVIRHTPLIWKRSLQGSSPPVQETKVPWVLGAAMAIRREAFESAGGFDESFFMYFEEVDLCYRLAQAGRQTHFLPAAEVVHVGGVSTAQHEVEMNLQYFTSLARFYRKHYSWVRLAQLVVLVESYALIRIVRDTAWLVLTHNKTRRARLEKNVAVSWQLLFGWWLTRAGLRPALFG
jgi:GT2 family glycosyltransferase